MMEHGKSVGCQSIRFSKQTIKSIRPSESVDRFMQQCNKAVKYQKICGEANLLQFYER